MYLYLGSGSLHIFYFLIQILALSGSTNGKKSTFKLINRYTSTFHPRTGKVQLFENSREDQLAAFNAKHSFTVNVVDNMRKKRRKTPAGLLHLQVSNGSDDSFLPYIHTYILQINLVFINGTNDLPSFTGIGQERL